MDATDIIITAIRARPVDVPMALPLHTSGGIVGSAPLVLIDLQTDAGLTGHSYVFCYAPWALPSVITAVETMGAMITGDALDPAAVEDKLQRSLRLIGAQGFAMMALGGLDMAVWDAAAKAAGLPLARALGGDIKPIPAYNSNGLGIIGAGKVGAEAQKLAAPGFGAIKVRLGYPDAAADVAVVAAVRDAVGGDIELMSDYNQCLTVAEAEARARALDGAGLAWIEEPTMFNDYSGHARIRAAAQTPIQTGENCWGAPDMRHAVDAGACDYFMADAVKIGGVTGWRRAAVLAESAGLPLSSHLFPEISAHLLAVSPTAHWLEYVDWASPILQTPARIENGHARAADTPGAGIAWNEAAVARYLV